MSQTVEQWSGYNPAFVKRIHARRKAEAEALERKKRKQEIEREKRERVKAVEAAASRQLAFLRAERNRIEAAIAAHVEELSTRTLAEQERDRRMIARIEARALRTFGITRDEFIGKCKLARIVIARQFYAYWARRMTKFSLPHIGRRLGTPDRPKDHTTVLHSTRCYPEKRKEMGRYLRPLEWSPRKANGVRE